MRPTFHSTAGNGNFDCLACARGISTCDGPPRGSWRHRTLSRCLCPLAQARRAGGARAHPPPVDATAKGRRPGERLPWRPGCRQWHLQGLRCARARGGDRPVCGPNCPGEGARARPLRVMLNAWMSPPPACYLSHRHSQHRPSFSARATGLPRLGDRSGVGGLHDRGDERRPANGVPLGDGSRASSDAPGSDEPGQALAPRRPR
mmetsp:Transcript_428/g.1077  ORF Transcript_428/g.1077 Transcript_428/m.1077 type:complete len:204 (+) Transcript_428:320-931(+)